MYLRSIIAIAGMLVTSCLSPHQTVVTDTGGGTWSESAEIEIPNADTVTPRDLYIVVRYNDSFRDDTLRLTIRTISPDSLVFEESYTLGLPPRRHPAALAEEASVPYRRHVIFPDSGIYRMAFTPAMPVRGVEAIGINQQKNANKKQMGKDKLRRFAENLTFECFVQPAFEEAFRRDHPLKGHWHSDFFP